MPELEAQDKFQGTKADVLLGTGGEYFRGPPAHTTWRQASETQRSLFAFGWQVNTDTDVQEVLNTQLEKT